jgi:hypothetical protein
MFAFDPEADVISALMEDMYCTDSHPALPWRDCRRCAEWGQARKQSPKKWLPYQRRPTGIVVLLKSFNSAQRIVDNILRHPLCPGRLRPEFLSGMSFLNAPFDCGTMRCDLHSDALHFT